MDIFTLAQWRARGLSRGALNRALAADAVRRVVKGAYAYADVPDTLESRAMAVRLVRPHDTVLCRQTAAWLGEIDVLPPGQDIAREPIHAIVSPDVTPTRVHGVKPYQAELVEADVIEQHGLRRTRDLRTALDLGRFSPRPRAVAALDAFLHHERVSVHDLWRRTTLLVACRNCRRLRANLAVADGGAESIPESEQRVLFIDAGLPRPTTQIPVHDSWGELIGRLDLGWRAYRVGSEFDGEADHSSREQRAHDAVRRERMRNEAGWAIDVAGKGELWGRPAELVAVTSERLLQRGWKPACGEVLEQISRAREFEARTGQQWRWMPLERLLRC